MNAGKVTAEMMNDFIKDEVSPALMDLLSLKVQDFGRVNGNVTIITFITVTVRPKFTR